jgi:hypothetical protein
MRKGRFVKNRNRYNRARRWARNKRFTKICPICRLSYNSRDRKRVLYHVSYLYQCIIYACRFCNNVEYRLRHGLSLTSYQQRIAERIQATGLTYYNFRKIRKPKSQKHYENKGYWVVFHTPFGELRKWRTKFGLKTLVSTGKLKALSTD